MSGDRFRTVTLIPGDGIGPEVTESVQEVFEVARVPIRWERAEAGLHALERRGTALPAETLESLRRNRVGLKGPTTTPIGKGHKSINVTLRKSLGLFANVRPVKSLPGVHSRFDNVDLIVVRENIEDTYGGIEHWQTPQVVQCLRFISRPGSLAVLRFAFETARALGRRRVTCVHKANIHKLSDGLFLDCFRQVSEEYPDLESDDLLIDNACMQLVSRPETFDVLVLPNLFGDVVSDLCAGLVGGLGVAPGANIGQQWAVFEAVHGSALDIAGKGIANPTALLLSAVQMLRYLELHAHAERIETALRLALVSGIKTPDLGGHAGIREFTRTVISALPHYEVPAEKRRPTPAKTTTARPQPAEPESQERTLRGADVFVYQPEGRPDLPRRVGKLRLAAVGNRGTRVDSEPSPDILLVDWFQARYLASEPLQDSDLLPLFQEISRRGCWVHVEKLFEQAGAPLYGEMESM